MSAHKSDVNEANSELNDGNNPVSITFYVEDIPLIANTIHTVKCLFDICKTCPMAILHNIRPNL